MKAAFMPFGGGSRGKYPMFVKRLTIAKMAPTLLVCVGQALARMEMRLAVAHFFRRYPHARISEKEAMTDDDMKPKMYFLVSPKGHRCLVQLS